VYGKFFAGKAGFISRQWWPDFCNYRRSLHPAPAENSIEDTILLTLQERGPFITRELRAACGFTGPKMRSKFDGYGECSPWWHLLHHNCFHYLQATNLCP
jgi:hypothetical protein